jgi:hypothetical protein
VSVTVREMKAAASAFRHSGSVQAGCATSPAAALAASAVPIVEHRAKHDLVGMVPVGPVAGAHRARPPLFRAPGQGLADPRFRFVDVAVGCAGIPDVVGQRRFVPHQGPRAGGHGLRDRDRLPDRRSMLGRRRANRVQ